MPCLFAQTPPSTEFDGVDGFLGTRGSLMLDVVFLAMFAIVPVMLLSIYLVRYRKQFQLHKQLQIALGAVLLVAVLAFEVDMRLFTDWEQRAEPSPYYRPDAWNAVWYTLIVHLAFAVPTAMLWVFVIVQAIRKFPVPTAPGTHSRQHVLWARLAAGGMVMTAVTGWIFYWLAFVA